MIERAEELVTVFGGGGFIGRYVVRDAVQERRPGARRRRAIRASPISSSRSARSANRVRPSQHRQCRSVARAVEGADAVDQSGRRAQGQFPRGPCRPAPALSPRPRATPARRRWSTSRRSAPIPQVAIRLRPLQGRGRGGGARRLPRPRRSSVRRSCSGPRTSSPTASPAWRSLPFLPVIAAQRRFQPVYVRDLAQAIAAAALDPGAYAGETYEIGGPQVMTMRELNAGRARGQRPVDRAWSTCPISSAALLSRVRLAARARR